MLRLKRDVGLFGATMYILGVIIGAGIYVIIGSAAGIAGPALWVSFLAAAVIAACTGFSYAELSSTFPYDGAEYVYTERAFGDKRFSFGIGWLKVITHCIAMSAVSLGFGGYLSMITGWSILLCALILLGFVTMINLVGLKAAVEFDIAMVVVAVLGLIIVIVFGAPSVHSPDFYWEMPSGVSGMFSAAALVFFAFLGFENVGNIGEEVRNPRKTLPAALVLSVIISTVLYVLVAVVAVSVVPWQELGQSVSPLSDVMTVLLGSKAGFVMAIMALAATGSTVLGLFIGTSRMLYGLAEENTLPAYFMRLSRKARVPYVSIIVTAFVCALFILPGDIKTIAFLTNFGALFIFMAVNLCLILLRYSQADVPRGFRVPLNIGRFPVIPLLGLLSCLALMISFDKILFVAGIGLFLVGLLIYHFVSLPLLNRKAMSLVAQHRQTAGSATVSEKKRIAPPKSVITNQAKKGTTHPAKPITKSIKPTTKPAEKGTTKSAKKTPLTKVPLTTKSSARRAKLNHKVRSKTTRKTTSKKSPKRRRR